MIIRDHITKSVIAIRLWVPSTFWDDHAERCPSDEGPRGICTEVRQSGRRTLIVGTPEQLECLRSDAGFYAEGNVDDCPALVRSARLTLAAIERALKEK